jgi:hypothetical protein
MATVDPTDALVRAGALRACPEHHDIYVRTHDKEAEKAAYAIGTVMLKRRESGLQHQTEFMDSIAFALANAPEACFICEAAAQED